MCGIGQGLPDKVVVCVSRLPSPHVKFRDIDRKRHKMWQKILVSSPILSKTSESTIVMPRWLKRGNSLQTKLGFCLSFNPLSTMGGIVI